MHGNDYKSDPTPMLRSELWQKPSRELDKRLESSSDEGPASRPWSTRNKCRIGDTEARTRIVSNVFICQDRTENIDQ